MEYKVFLVCSNHATRELIREFLLRTGQDFQIDHADHLSQGFESIRQVQPDLVLLDLDAENHKAVDLISSIALNDVNRKIPIVVFGSRQTPEILNDLWKAGVFDFISKPLAYPEFSAGIIKVLEMVDSYRQIDLKIKRAKDEIQTLENLMVSSANTPFAFIVISPSGEIEWANDGFERLHGYRFNEYGVTEGKSIFNLAPGSEIAGLFMKCVTEKQSIEFICKVKMRTGDSRWLQIFITPQLDSAGLVEKLVAIEIDITAFKNKEEELNKQYRQMKEITRNLEKANAQLEVQKGEINQQKMTIEEEQEKSEKLLLNILPFEVAKQLKSKGRTGTRQYKLVTVLFTDFKGFSNISKTLDPKNLVSILDSYFAKFDEIISAHYIEKIKTIGDAYMCAGGLPLSNKSNPVDAVLAGLEIQQYMNALNDSKVVHNQPVWELRLGIHSGPVVAGVVGKKRFAYDIWGDTVNIASRMEQSGHVGWVNISGVTYDYIRDFFDCDYRGKIETKNLGKIDMYFVNRIKPEFSKDKLGILPNEQMINLVNKL
jgi:PAS domain S-box-containing protein